MAYNVHFTIAFWKEIQSYKLAFLLFATMSKKTFLIRTKQHALWKRFFPLLTFQVAALVTNFQKFVEDEKFLFDVPFFIRKS